MSLTSQAPAAEPARRPTRADWAIRIGQVAITVVLTVFAASRALGDGAPVPWVLAMSLLFGGWYFGGLFFGDRTRDPVLAIWWLAGLVLIWTGLILVSAEFVWLAFPLWLLAAFILPLRVAIPVSVLILAVVVAGPILHTGTISYPMVVGPLVGGAFAFGMARGYLELIRDGRERRRLIASLVAAQDEMAHLQDELARTQRETGAGIERTRLSRDIHDTVAQGLSSIAMLARGADPHDADTSGRTFEQIERLAHAGLADARRIVNAMTPAELEGAALGDALRRMLARMHDETGIRADVHVDETVPALPMPVEVALLRTAQSALANVRSHAQAGRVVVSLVDAGDVIRLDVVDDGVGFDATRWETHRPRRDDGGYGLRAMRGRLRELGGELEVESAPGDGTALSASLPLTLDASRAAGEGSDG